MQNNRYTIGIIGGGFVGTAVAGFFKAAAVYDKFKPMDSFEEVMSRDLIFLCVPTPYKNSFDRSALDDVFEAIGKTGKEKIVVIKSTSIPGTTDFFQDKYPHLKVLFNPEFLTQATAQQDYLNPDKQILGYTKKSRSAADKVLAILPDAPYKKIMPAKATELVKYAINSYYATKVVFGNMLYDLAQSLGVDYQDVKQAFVADQRICDSHFDIMHGGYRGYGGKCLPKDLKSLRDMGKDARVDVRLLEAVDSMNDKYRAL